MSKERKQEKRLQSTIGGGRRPRWLPPFTASSRRLLFTIGAGPARNEVRLIQARALGRHDVKARASRRERAGATKEAEGGGCCCSLSDQKAWSSLSSPSPSRCRFPDALPAAPGARTWSGLRIRRERGDRKRPSPGRAGGCPAINKNGPGVERKSEE